jgi:hypothetical protein
MVDLGAEAVNSVNSATQPTHRGRKTLKLDADEHQPVGTPEAMPESVKLERYEKRAAGRGDRAIRQIIRRNAE